MKSILIGGITTLLVIMLLYWTGKLTRKWHTDEDEIDEKDYISKGGAIWMIAGFVLMAIYVIGKIVEHFYLNL